MINIDRRPTWGVGYALLSVKKKHGESAPFRPESRVFACFEEESMTRVILACSLLFWGQQLLAYEAELERLAGVITSRLGEESTIAVTDFRNLEGQVTTLGKFLADEFSVSLLMGSDSVQLFDRGNLQRLLEEVQLSEDGVVSPETAKQLELAGVDVLITGLVTPLGTELRVSLRALDTSSARIVAAASGSLDLTDDLASLLSRTIVRSGAPAGLGSTSAGRLVLPGARDVGPFSLAIVDFKVLHGDDEVAAIVTVQNRSEDAYQFGVPDRRLVSATDEKGNLFNMTRGLSRVRWSFASEAARALVVPPGQSSEFTLYFEPAGRVESEGFGSQFNVTVTLTTRNDRTKATADYATTFREVSIGK